MNSDEILTTTPDLVPTSRNVEIAEPVDWQTAMKKAIRSGKELCQRLGLEPADLQISANSESEFPTFVPMEFLSRIQRGKPDDPLLRQVLPTADEETDVVGFIADPVGDLKSVATPGLLHKYHGRALAVSTGACGVHCRYCFRREFPYSDNGIAKSWPRAIEYIQEHSSLDEIILSGGDPLTLVDQKLDGMISDLESISHVRRLRLHSRMPIVIPQRVTDWLVQRLRGSRLTTWMVIHANHPQEFSSEVLAATDKCVDAGIPVLNQAVLLKGVNDDARTLTELCRLCVNHRIQPYYLHQLDRVRGAAHFEVPVSKGHELMSELRQNLPGYAVPKYVVEECGADSKTSLN